MIVVWLVICSFTAVSLIRDMLADERVLCLREQFRSIFFCFFIRLLLLKMQSRKGYIHNYATSKTTVVPMKIPSSEDDPAFGLSFVSWMKDYYLSLRAPQKCLKSRSKSVRYPLEQNNFRSNLTSASSIYLFFYSQLFSNFMYPKMKR